MENEEVNESITSDYVQELIKPENIIFIYKFHTFLY